MSSAEGDEEASYIVVVPRGYGGTAADPIENIGVGTVEQVLEAIELRLVKLGQVLIGEAPEDQIALARAAMPGSEQ
jgi:hypothetical protein